MSKIILDSTTSGTFRQLHEQVELIDESGLLLGTFIPVAKQRLYETLEIPFSTEELKRFAGEPGGRSLAEILTDLEKPS
jgi:hypothetical protein